MTLGRRLAVGLASVALMVLAWPVSASAVERPIVYAIVIDGLDGDNVDAGDAPFIASMLAGQEARAHYWQESRSVMVAETNPNHVAMMTGRYTEDSGVAGNTFAIYADLVGEEENEAATCEQTTEIDETKLPTETSGEHPSCIDGETVFKAIRRQGNPDQLTTAGVFGKAKLARLFGGKNKNGRRFAHHLWAPCTPSDGPDEEEYCADVPIEPITEDRTISDSTVMDEVIRTIREGVGPRQERPDFTFVNLPNVDNAGHVFGGGGLVYKQAIRVVDLELQRLVDELKSRGEWERTLLIVLSDHAHDETLDSVTLTSELEDAGIPADSFMIIDNGNADVLYLADRTSPDRFELLKRMREIIETVDGVDLALYREPNPADGGDENTIDGRYPGWRAAGPRTGDLVALADPGTRFSDPSSTSNPLPGNHGGWHTLDNTFLVASGGDGVVAGSVPGERGERLADTLANPGQAENVDMASTVLGVFGLVETRGNAGRYLDEALDEAALPGGAESSLTPTLKAKQYAIGGKLDRFFVRWGPEGQKMPRKSGGTWTLQVERGGKRGEPKWRTKVEDQPRQTVRVKVLRGADLRLRVRGRTAAGKLTDWTVLEGRTGVK